MEIWREIDNFRRDVSQSALHPRRDTDRGSPSNEAVKKIEKGEEIMAKLPPRKTFPVNAEK
jgi:hypothetical protein